MPNIFKKISVSGSPAEIGLQIGTLLKEEIHQNSDFYIPYIQEKLSAEQLSKAVSTIKVLLLKYSPDLVTEIEQMALGADISPDYLYAMNARTELLLSPDYNECTALVFPKEGILGQNWDWSNKLEDTSVVVEITKEDGHQIIQLTEAGICGKIGMNNYGIGITLNIHRTLDRNLRGVPIHIVMRCILECKTLEEARRKINTLPQGTASNLIIADNKHAFNVEYGGEQWQIFDIEDKAYVHTNHYIHLENVSVDDLVFENSLVRYDTAQARLNDVGELTVASMKEILSDASHMKCPIMRDYVPHIDKNMSKSGTVATILMDIQGRTFEVRKGNAKTKQFDPEHYEKYQLPLPQVKLSKAS